MYVKHTVGQTYSTVELRTVPQANILDHLIVEKEIMIWIQWESPLNSIGVKDAFSFNTNR